MKLGRRVVKITFASLMVVMSLAQYGAADRPYCAQGTVVGEVSSTSAILQARLTAVAASVDHEVPGADGFGRFHYADNDAFSEAISTEWVAAKADSDYIVRTSLERLEGGTRYYYQFEYGADREQTKFSPTGTFQTLQGVGGRQPVSFVVVTGMNYVSFHHGPRRQNRRVAELSYSGPDKHLGYPALAAIHRLKPDFFVATGDNVYYDSRDEWNAETLTSMRRKWHEQLSQPRFVELFREVPTYWEKDDHDHRYNDCDRSGDRAPSSELGIRVFREQVPVVAEGDDTSPTYRTYRVNQHLQIWLVEGRDYRSPNAQPDGPGKTLWGAAQREWLQRTLLASDATIKLLISPTPMVGPDDAYKIDNHTNHRGFRHEGRDFFRWVTRQRLHTRGFFVICGDRHWQYHSVDPTGIEEFSCGALCDSNSRLGRLPGDPDSTDPGASIKQPYTQTEASGGFLRVAVSELGTVRFQFFDERGTSLYENVRQPPGG